MADKKFDFKKVNDQMGRVKLSTFTNPTTMTAYAIISFLALLTFCLAAGACGRAIHLLTASGGYAVQVPDAMLAFSIFWLVGWAAQFGVYLSNKDGRLNNLLQFFSAWNIIVSAVAFVLAAVGVGTWHAANTTHVYGLLASYVAFALPTFPLYVMIKTGKTKKNDQQNPVQ